MYFHFDNITDTTINVDLKYSVMDGENNVYETGEIKKDILPKTEDQIVPLETNVARYGIG